jgi:hypothetical protein
MSRVRADVAARFFCAIGIRRHPGAASVRRRQRKS